MAYKIMSTKKDVCTDDSVIHFLCDTEADVAALPTNRRTGNKVCAAGSTAFVITPDSGKSPRRILTEAGEWVESPEQVIIDCGTPATRA